MPDITPDLQREIEETAKLLSTKFAQPEFIPGCEVKSITDINLYATNNGWIEAVCGQHNQQRVRWKSSETVAVNDFVDVLYFPDRRVFEIYGIGGSTAIVAPGGGWPFDNVLTVSTTDPDAEYATLPLAIAAAVAGDVISLDAETYSLTAMETLADIGLTIEGKGPGATIITSSITNSTGFFINAANITFRNLTVIHTGAGTASGCFQVNANNFTLDNVSVEKTSGAPTTGYGVWIYAGTGHRFYNGTKIVCTSGTTRYGIQNSIATITLTMEGGRVEGTTQDIFGDQAGSTITLNNVVLVNDLISYTGLLLGTHLGVAAYHNAAQSINNATDTSLALNSERRDDSRFHDTATNNSRLTVPAGMAGWYQITGNVAYASDATGARQTSILMNGATYLVVNLQQAVAGGFGTLVGVSVLYYLAVGDYIELRAYQTSGGALNVDSLANYSPELRMVRVR